MIYTPHFILFWAFIRHLSFIRRSKTKKPEDSQTSLENILFCSSDQILFMVQKQQYQKSPFPQLGFIRPAWITAAFFYCREKFLPSKNLL